MYPKIERLVHPGFLYHPFHETIEKQVDGVYSCGFIIKGGSEAGRKLTESVKIPALAVSSGDINSLIEDPASMTHVTYSKEELEKVGFRKGLIRLSVGPEGPNDLIEDLDRALSQI